MRMFLWVVLCGFVAGQPLPADDWIEKSDENAKLLLKTLAKYSPEQMSALGFEETDERIVDLNPRIDKRLIQESRAVLGELKKRLEKETHTAIRQDLEILIHAVEQTIKDVQLQQKYMYPYFNLAETIFYGVRGLLDDRVAPERYPAALVRLRKYAGLEQGHQPLTRLARDRMAEGRKVKGLLWPVKSDMEQYLANSVHYMAGIEQLFKKFEVKGYEKAFQTLQNQLNDYHAFLKTEYLPNARDDFRLPLELYRFKLAQTGVSLEPEDLIQRAEIAFMEITHEMNAIARLISKERGLDTTDYRDVIRILKKDQLVGEQIMSHYQGRIKDLEKLIRKHRIVTLPKREMRFRFATEAESAAVPAPHMNPPRMIGNRGEIGEFVLPLAIPGEGGKTLKFDDFTFAAASWTLTVHEGRPGHELQFASIVEKGVSLARGLFAFNSANVEGWALYCEAVMKPFMPPEGQLISLQHRLLRAARAFLDPKLQLGLITPEAAKAVLIERVMISEALATEEVNRYTFWSPAQATAYFVGYSNLMALRAEVELLLGNRLDLQQFHDFILSQGVLPNDLLRKEVLAQFAPRAPTKPE